MVCSKCGTQNADGVKFCTSCGAPLGTNDSTTVLNPDAQPFEAAPVAPVAPEAPVAPVAPAAPVAPQPQGGKNKKGMIIGIVAAVVVVLAIVGVVLGLTLGKKDAKKSDKDETKTTEVSSTNANGENATAAPAADADSKDVDYVGTWEMEMDYGKIFNETLKDEGMDVKFSSAIVKIIWTFNADGTYKTSVDEASAKTAFASLKKDYKAFMTEMFAEEGMTIEDYEAATGESLDDFIDEMFDESEIAEAFVSEGKYKFDGSKLYTSESLSEDIDTNDYMTYEIVNSKELKFTADSSATDDVSAAMLPMTMKKK